MAFRTKLDYSSNRQIKQNPETFTALSGGTIFGLPYSALTSGPNPYTSGSTIIYTELVSTFSGNTGTTVYTWFDNIMELGRPYLSALTPSNSGITQDTGFVFTASTTTIIDGNTVALGYSGISFSITPISMIELSANTYSGTVYTPFVYSLEADSLDFTGRTIWVDVCGITRTDSLIVLNDATFSNIGSLPSSGALHYTSGGTLTVNTSDKRLKTNITPISNALSQVTKLNGVYYNWYDNPDGNKRIGLIAQDVEKVVPELVFKNEKSPEKYLGVHYDNIGPLLIEAIKELAVGGSNIIQNTEIHTQTVVAEDNNIELNYNGTQQSAINGGLTVLKGVSDDTNAEIKIDNKGHWVTNNAFKPFELIIPYYTPINSNDTSGSVGTFTRDDDYLYLKGNNNLWKRIKLEEF